MALKTALRDALRSQGLAVEDVGTHGTDPVDYPDIAAAVARLVARREADAGIVIDGAGLGSAIAANKIDGIRAAMCTDRTLARYAREHNGANVLALGATLVNTDEAKAIVQTFIGDADARGALHRAGWRRFGTSNGRITAIRSAAIPVSDIRRVIDIILQELAAAGAVAPARCGCHGFASIAVPNR